MTLDRTFKLGILALLAACSLDKDLLTTTVDPPGTGTTADATTDATTDATVDPTGGTEATGTDATGTDATGDTSGSDTTGPSVDIEAMCAAQTDEASCEAISQEVQDGWADCVWLNWTPVTLAGDACSFGETQGKCYYQFTGSEGCAFYEACGKPGTGAVWKKEGDVVSLAYGSYCVTPPEGQDCSPEFPRGDVAPECACTCTPEFLP